MACRTVLHFPGPGRIPTRWQLAEQLLDQITEHGVQCPNLDAAAGLRGLAGGSAHDNAVFGQAHRHRDSQSRYSTTVDQSRFVPAVVSRS